MKPQAIAHRFTLFFLVIVIILGICFRFVNLAGKVYWIDEVHTSLRAAGYSRTEFVDMAPRGEIVGIEQLQKFQQLTPTRGLWAATKAISSSEHSPLYYGLARIGMELFGSSPTVTRGVAAVLGLLLLPAVYWLAHELFSSQLVSLSVTALVASSPIHILYAQEAREYSLLAVTVALASAVFWRLSKDKSFQWWWYGLAIALGFYTHPLFLLVVIAHGVYSFAISSFSWSNLLKKYFWATGLGIVLFVPWILVFIFNDDGVGMWIERDLPLHFWLQRWVLNLSSTFFDWQVVYPERFFDVEKVSDFWVPWSFPFLGGIFLLSLLLLYSLYFLLRYSDFAQSFFLLTLIGGTAIGLGFPDLAFGGQRSTVARYVIAVPLAIEVIVGYALAASTVSGRIVFKQLWRGILLFLLTTSLLCSWQMLQAPTWWNKYSSYYNSQTAELINQSPQPLVISNAKRISRSTSLSYELKDNSKFLLMDQDDDLSTIPRDRTYDLFIFRPYPEFLQRLQDSPQFSVETIFAPGHLYKLKQN